MRADQRAKEKLIVNLTEQIAGLTDELAAVRADQGAKAALIDRISVELEEVRADQRAKEELIVRISGEIEALRAEQGAKEGVIARPPKGSWWRR